MARSSVLITVLLILVHAVSSQADGRSLQDALLGEVARVEREMKDVVPAGQRANAEARLRRAEEAARKGRYFLALHELSTPWRLQASFTYVAKTRDRVKTFDDFKREWSSVGEPPPATPPNDLPAAVGALATSSESAGPPTYRASLPYAADTDIESGLFYLGDAHAAPAFGHFCRSLTFAEAGSRLALRSISAEMDRFERDMVGLYDKADANTRRAFIPINVGMKIARERDTAGDYPAALLQYLLAREQLGTIVTRDAAADASTRLEQFSAALTGADHTIAKLFLEAAAAGLESQDARSRRAATAIADFVLPEYVEIVRK